MSLLRSILGGSFSLRKINQLHTKELFYRPCKKNILIFKLFQHARLLPFFSARLISSTPSLRDQSQQGNHNDSENVEDEDSEDKSEESFINKYYDEKDRSRIIPPETSMKYMDSKAFETSYGNDFIWRKYRRNMKGTPRYAVKSRETCVRQERITTGSPCPLCRDQYLVLDYRNVSLLKHFIDPYTGQIINPDKTHICQKQWRLLQVHIEKAKDHGFLDVDVEQVEYDYKEYSKRS